MVPEGWCVVPLGELSELVTSGSRGWAKYYSESGDPFIRITNLRRNKIDPDYSKLKYVTLPASGNEGQRTKLSRDDILVSITAELGTIGFIREEPVQQSYINQHVALVRLKDRRAFPEFVANLLASTPYNYRFQRLNDSGAKAGLNLSSIRSLPVTLPPTEEQRRIAEILGTWDRAIETTEKLIAASEAQKKALMQRLLTGQKRLPGFEGEWRSGILGDFLDSIFGGGTPDKSKPDYWGGKIAWASVKDMGGLYLGQTSDSITKEGLDASSSKMVEPGRVITATRMAVGSVVRAKIPVAINQDLKAFIPSSVLSDDYLFILLRYWAPALEARGTGSTVKGIRLETLENLPVQIPSVDEQAAIFAVILNSDRESEQRLAQLQTLKTEKAALMQQLLTGKRRVNLKEMAA